MSDLMISIEEKNKQRKTRVSRLKKIIIGSIVFSILFPTILSFFLMVRIISLQEQVDELSKVLLKNEEIGEINKSANLADGVYATELPKEMQMENQSYDAMQVKVEEEEKATIAYLTFDDGPSENTSQILDILKNYDVKATFFVVGKETDEAKALYKRIVDEGHTLGMHSYSHQYSEIYNSVESFAKDEKKLRDLLYESTGVIPTLYRFPGGSNNLVSNIEMTEFIKYLNNENITYFDWNVASGDATSQNISVETLVNNVLNNVEENETSVILMHDALQKNTSVEALSIIIESLQNLGIQMKALDQNVPHVQHIEAETVNN
ncbi:polysaccharide deacetylase family protein [Candidatus Galacturonibacter soehngenii]|uniref:Polysaccharide deacetylase n=1 Tax=Candidatus Galacturonatibacter soehngenii TaxID=2307010 RepID=A0A7V7QJJ7_9FIRM|nr:polysaccharide deacetylase family protein [Candidatus Galacturonibacter soehngenii]KAB1437676.1 polysaccharide deacetylase [Candidatus Galacturonibacter soehngenii]MBA4686904.1 polysaccharide deacetylase [Candidatus Galacturonibacter soehngenii]